MTLRRRLVACAIFTVALWLGNAGAARAGCPAVDAKLTEAQDALRAAEPARDATPADFERRITLVSQAFDATDAAETIRTTTEGGCRDLQQVYDVMLTDAWAKLVLAYLKPSFDYYVTDAGCRDLSRLHTISLVANAGEAMERSMISWNPFVEAYVIERDHVTRMVPAAAAFLHVDLPGPDGIEEFARRYSYGLEVARSRTTTDCAASVSDKTLPAALLVRIFGK